MRFKLSAALFLCAIGNAQTLGVTGAELLSPDQYALVPLAPVPMAGPLPDSATLERLFPAPGNQGKMLSCTAWATAYNKAYRLFLASGQKGKPDDYLQSPSFIYSFLTENACNRGTYILTALQFLKIVGSVHWSRLPYSEAECSDWRVVRDLARNNSYGSYRLTANADEALTSLREQIVAGHPIIAGIRACQEFQTPPADGIYATADGKCEGHAVVVVGYDDRRQAVRILNSWGTTWADAGKVWMGYSVFKKRLNEAYIDLGPGPGVPGDLSWLTSGKPPTQSGQSPIATLTPEILKAAIRANIGERILARFGTSPEGEKINVSIWSIWLNLPSDLAAQIRSVGYSFQHPTFKHNPQKSINGSSVFLAQWRGYGCVDEAYLEATLKNGNKVRADFNFCEATFTQMPEAVSPKK